MMLSFASSSSSSSFFRDVRHPVTKKSISSAELFNTWSAACSHGTKTSVFSPRLKSRTGSVPLYRLMFMPQLRRYAKPGSSTSSHCASVGNGTGDSSTPPAPSTDASFTKSSLLLAPGCVPLKRSHMCNVVCVSSFLCRGAHSKCKRLSSPSNCNEYPPWYTPSSRAAAYFVLKSLNTLLRRSGDVLLMNSPLLKKRKYR
mmetsp:Transcript_9647/g.40933  ORF Transcript_9647/g.40933 Transcript_9647/m.40933 type:complete len:200 (+) Transcript_9647:2911-3510(+)